MIVKLVATAATPANKFFAFIRTVRSYNVLDLMQTRDQLSQLSALPTLFSQKICSSIVDTDCRSRGICGCIMMLEAFSAWRSQIGDAEINVCRSHGGGMRVLN